MFDCAAFWYCEYLKHTMYIMHPRVTDLVCDTFGQQFASEMQKSGNEKPYCAGDLITSDITQACEESELSPQKIRTD